MSEGNVAVFLDRDGTVNEEVDFLTSPIGVRLIPGAGSAIRKLNEHGLITCIISNQSGVARGFLSEEDLVAIHARLVDELQLHGARLDRIYFCPHHPTEGMAPYAADCQCRKPKPGMLKQAKREFNLDLERCFVVGDRMVDVQAGLAVKATPILVLTGYGRQTISECAEKNLSVPVVVENVYAAVEYIIEHVK